MEGLFRSVAPIVIAIAGSVLATDAWFTDVTADALPGVTTTSGGLAKDYIVEVNGGGLALGDLDLDGDLDLVVIDGSTLARVTAGRPGFPPRAFLNDGAGRFTPGGDAWVLAAGRWGTGCALGDVDGDRDLDLVVTEWGQARLYLNDGGRGFGGPRALTEPRPGPGPEPATDDGPEWATSAAFLDYDGDGHLDLFVARYLAPNLAPDAAHGGSWKGRPVMLGPQGLAPLTDRLFRGLGDGRFEDVTEATGIASAPAGYGLGVMTLDADGDGDTDVFVANDSSPNQLWRNRGDGTFVEEGLRAGLSHDGEGRAQASMGIAIGDLDDDGHDDLFVTNFSSESNTLYLARASGSFRDHTTRRGLVAPSLQRLGWGTGLQDVDLDGDLDLWVLNGHVYPEADGAGTDTSYAQEDQLLVQGAHGRFEARPLATGPSFVSRAGVQGDLDRDGDLDLVVLTLDGPVRVLRNDAPRGVAGSAARWLGVRLAAPAGNTQGLGARVTLRQGARAQRREVRTTAGFQAACAAEVHFSWLVSDGDDAPTELTLEVRWPDGLEQRVAVGAPDRWLTIERTAPRAAGGDD